MKKDHGHKSQIGHLLVKSLVQDDSSIQSTENDTSNTTKLI